MLGPVGGATTTFFLSLSIGSGSSESVCGGGEGGHSVGFFSGQGDGGGGGRNAALSRFGNGMAIGFWSLGL